MKRKKYSRSEVPCRKTFYDDILVCFFPPNNWCAKGCRAPIDFRAGSLGGWYRGDFICIHFQHRLPVGTRPTYGCFHALIFFFLALPQDYFTPWRIIQALGCSLPRVLWVYSRDTSLDTSRDFGTIPRLGLEPEEWPGRPRGFRNADRAYCFLFGGTYPK